MTSANIYLPGTIQTPSSLVITAITRAFPMVVTIEVNPITESNTYMANQLVLLSVPQSYGMFQANQLTGQILSVDGLDITLDIDSRGFDAFVVPSATSSQPAMLSPSGSRNLQYNNNTRNVPFKSLNNIGN